MPDRIYESERDSLPAHVDLCAERYQGLATRLTRIEYILYALCGLVVAEKLDIIDVILPFK